MASNASATYSSIRNIGIIAHIDAGKTTVTERFLFYSGKTHRIGDIDSGNTVMDYLDEERSRGITIVAAAASFEWAGRDGNTLIHLIDTPGHIDFTAEVERSIRVSDGAVVIFSGVEGVEAQSEKVWRQSNHYGVPKIAFVNKLDRLGASFQKTFEEIQQKFTDVTPVQIQLPVGIESEFSGVIDLIDMNMVEFQGDEGSEIVKGDIPDDMIDEAENARDNMLTAFADLSDSIAEVYLEGEDVPSDLIRGELRRLIGTGDVCPVLCGSAKKNIGIQPLLDAIIDFLPAPEDRKEVDAIDPRSGEVVKQETGGSNFYGLIFKIVASGSADLLYMRTYSGTLKLNDTLVNPRTKEKVRVKRILRLYAKNVEAIEEVGSGDIVGLIGPQGVNTGDTLCCVNHPLLLEKITFPEPVISMAIEPRSSKDKDRLVGVLELLCREDPTLFLDTHETTGQMLLSGMGELHLEINANRIREEFNVDARCGKPRVAFRETLTGPCSITGVFDKTIGDKEFYCEVDIDFYTERLECGHLVENGIKHHNIPGSWILSAENALDGGLKTGGTSGYSLTYIRAVLKDLRGTPDRTNEGAAAGAVLDAVSKAILKGTVMLEPIMKLDITAPEECIGEITGYLQARRAVIHNISPLPSGKRLNCEVPLAEMFGFSKALPKLSGGRAGFSMEPCGFQEVSQDELDRMIQSSSTVF